MSYLTLEVEIDHGKVTTKEPSKLPEKASGLLTILQPETSGLPKLTPLEALDALQKHLHSMLGRPQIGWRPCVKQDVSGSLRQAGVPAVWLIA